MRKITIFMLLILSITLIGCNKKSETAVNTKAVKEATKIFSEVTDDEIYNYSMRSKVELLNWFNSEQSKEINNGAFSFIVDIYVNNCKYILVPDMGDNEINSIFIDSNNVFINYVFIDPLIRVCIEPLIVEENKNIDITDIKKYTEQKYGIKFNEEESIDLEEQIDSMGVKTGYEYDSYIYTPITVEFKDGEKECVLRRRSSEKSDTEYTLSFIEEDMLVKIFYYNSEDDAIFHKLGELSFVKEILQ